MQTSRARTLASLFLFFLFLSFLGWFYEVFLEVVVYRWGYSDRGVLLGPWCPVYGVGALMFLLCFDRLRRVSSSRLRLFMPLLIFLGCMAVATLLELATSYVLEWLSGSWPWQTYSNYAIHFQGRIALSPSLRFGLGGVLIVYVLHPLFLRLTHRLPDRTLIRLALVLFILFLIDLLLTTLVF